MPRCMKSLKSFSFFHITEQMKTHSPLQHGWEIIKCGQQISSSNVSLGGDHNKNHEKPQP